MSNKIIYWYAKLLVICLGIVMFTIPMSFAVKNIFFERMGVCEPWMEFFMRGDTEFLNALEGNASDEGNREVPVEIDWETEYPFQAFDSGNDTGQTNSLLDLFQAGMDAYVTRVKSLEEKIGYYCEDGLIFYDGAVSLASELEHAAGIEILAGGDVLRMNNGFFTYPEPKRTNGEIQEIADEVADFRRFLSAQGISFFYANAGSKVCPYDRQLPNTAEEYTNENGTALLEALEIRGVDTFDFREEMVTDELDWYDSYYQTDHHWKTETGLWAAGKLAEKLNEEAGLHFDSAIFEKENYRFDTFENCFLGGQGRMVTLANARPEGYTRILPVFETHFSLQIPTRSVELEGSYEDVLFNEKQLEQILSYSSEDYMYQPDAYSCARARNDALVHIRNFNPQDNADKKILFLQDSFSWYSTSFLACDIGAVDVIHLPEFTGSVRSYIEKTKPDAVVLMYCERNVKAIDWETHESTFDLR